MAPNRSRMIFAHMRRAARNLATSSNRSFWATKKKDSRPAKSSTSRPGVHGGPDVGDGVGEGEGQLLNGGGARLPHVVPADADGVSSGGTSREQYLNTSTTRRIDVLGG